MVFYKTKLSHIMVYDLADTSADWLAYWMVCLSVNIPCKNNVYVLPKNIGWIESSSNDAIPTPKIFLLSAFKSPRKVFFVNFYFSTNRIVYLP
jgi:hypothetical protein